MTVNKCEAKNLIFLRHEAAIVDQCHDALQAQTQKTSGFTPEPNLICQVKNLTLRVLQQQEAGLVDCQATGHLLITLQQLDSVNPTKKTYLSQKSKDYVSYMFRDVPGRPGRHIFIGDIFVSISKFCTP